MATFTAYLFEGKKTAGKVLDTLEDSSNDYPWIDDVAVVAKNNNGHLKIHSTWAQDELGASGFGWGAFTGALLGLMASPAGALAGAAMGGSVWGLFGKAMDGALNDPKLDEFGDQLGNDKSALVLVSDEEYLSDYEMTLQPFNGTLIQTDLNETDIKYIKEKIKESKNN